MVRMNYQRHAGRNSSWGSLFLLARDTMFVLLAGVVIAFLTWSLFEPDSTSRYREEEIRMEREYFAEPAR